MSRIKLFLILTLLIWLAHPFAAVDADVAGGRLGLQPPNTIVDQAGRRIVVGTPFQRVISLYGAHTENLFSLGLIDEIIGVSQHEDFPPQAMSKPVFSYHDDPEKFIAARPDLVLIRPMIDRGYPQFVAMLEASGIVVISLQPATVDDMFIYWEILGILTGKQERALGLISRFKRSISDFKDLADARLDKKRVYFEAIHSKMKTFAPDSMAVFALETAGGINIAVDAEPVRKTNIAYYGKERILSHAAEIDVFLAQSGAMNRPTVSMIKNEPGFHVIKAVRHDQIYIIEEQIVSRPTMRLLEGIYHIGRILYPTDFDKKATAILRQAKGLNIEN
ncbi:MAG: ABC transporter substrate-binding protein [Desulfobacterales bacterium]|nr:MAG: ABC transporter substrate-binding protein [Desulfobacterales bacterium]